MKSVMKSCSSNTGQNIFGAKWLKIHLRRLESTTAALPTKETLVTFVVLGTRIYQDNSMLCSSVFSYNCEWRKLRQFYFRVVLFLWYFSMNNVYFRLSVYKLYHFPLFWYVCLSTSLLDSGIICTVWCYIILVVFYFLPRWISLHQWLWLLSVHMQCTVHAMWYKASELIFTVL